MQAPADQIEMPRERDLATHWFRFSVKSLLIVFALVAVYLGGRASMLPNWFAPQAGTWRLVMKSGQERPAVLSALPDGGFVLDVGRDRSMARNNALGGKYRWNSGKLTVEVPNDRRYMGLEWQRDGDHLVLVAEPAGMPAGTSYLGTELWFVSQDASPATIASVPVAPARNTRTPSQSPSVVGQRNVLALKSSPWRDPEPGRWQLILPAGFVYEIEVRKLEDGTFDVVHSGNLGGTYRVKDKQFEVVKPRDARFMGLTWVWKDDELVLIAEPSPPPAGASYVGARMRALKKEGEQDKGE